jgi:ATP-dependent Clp protease ATP-binding subunit ClpA
VFERLAGDARRAVERAQERARLVGAESVQPEHLLLALTCGGADNPAARALAEAGIDDDAVVADAIEQDLVARLEVVGVPPSVVASVPALPRGDRPPLGLAMRGTLEQSLREAVSSGSRRIGPEHLLLGSLRPPAASVARILSRLHVDPERLVALVRLEMAAARGRCA